MTILTLAKGAKWAWDEYRKTSSSHPGNSVEELRARLDASEAILRSNYELIGQLGAQLEACHARIDAQDAEIVRLDRRAGRLAVLTYGLLVLALGCAAYIAYTGLR